MAKKARKYEPVKIGICGCGNISGTYLKRCRIFESLRVVACTDIIMERAEAKHAEYPDVRALTVEEFYAEREFDIVVNLTPPPVHPEVAMLALRAGKSIHTEKPMAVTRDEARAVISLAKKKGLRVGGAPDTFLGAGLQTCRQVIDEGRIGKPIAATAFMMGRGPESWHPDPEFFYKVGGGPMFDMGPYYLTALVTLMGPVKRVCGSAQIISKYRTITSKPKYGKKIKVEVPTHIAGVMDFSSGAVATIITSFDVWGHHLPCIEIHGTEGSLSVPDPNTFGGPVRIHRPGMKEWEEVPVTRPYAENSRGIGVADMACSIRSGRPQRASGELTYHVLDLMHAFHDSSRLGRHIMVKSTVERPAPLPLGLKEGEVDY